MALMTKTDGKPPRGQRSAKAGDTPSGTNGDMGKAKAKGKGKGKVSPTPEQFVPTLPEVNLLPRAVVEQARVQRLRRTFGGAALAAVAVVGAAYVVQSGAITSANDELASEQTTASRLASEVTALTPVKVYYATVEANEALIRETMSREVLLSDIVGRLDATAPAGVDLGTIEVSVDTTPAPVAVPGGAETATPPVPVAPTSGACPSPDPYLPPGATAGCITINGTAESRQALGDWESKLSRTDVFADLFISSSTAGAVEGGDAITFTASVSVTDQAYAGRYADPTFLEGTAP
jgi:Tfp pilus assembly protein PilN